MAAAKRTIDHDEIRAWAEERGGRPVIVAATEDDEGGGLLRIDFGEPNEEFEEIDWERFFEVFEENELALLHQDETASGKPSRFAKFVRRTDEEA